MRGFYRVDYTGLAGMGAGAAAFVDGRIAGLDVAGGVYTGTYVEEPSGEVKGALSLRGPEGGWLVTGQTVPKGAPPLHIPFVLGKDAMGGHVFRVELPTGPVNVRLTKVADL